LGHLSHLKPKNKSQGTWRDHLHPDDESKVTGIINLSPSWFSQGHEGLGESLHASSDIQYPDNITFLTNLAFTNGLIAAI
jgi:hypothetical protein